MKFLPLFSSTLRVFCWLYPPVLFQIAVLISIGFICCWTPYGLVSLWSIFRDSSTIPPEVSLLPCMFAKSSTVYNPVIYYFFSQSFKREVNQLSWLCLCCKPCKVSNTISDNNIYMVSASIKPKEQPRSTLQEITESKSVSLGWKTGLFFGAHLRTKTENNVLSGQTEVFLFVSFQTVCGIIPQQGNTWPFSDWPWHVGGCVCTMY